MSRTKTGVHGGYITSDTIEQLRAEQRAHYLEDMAETLRAVTAPDLSQAPDYGYKPRPAAYGSRARLYSPAEPLYRRMSEDERDWRNPDADHLYAQWLRSTIHRDHQKMREAEDRIAEMFGARATATEGVAAASGAFSTGTGGTLIPRPLEQVVYIARDRTAKARRFVNILPMTQQTHNVPTAASMTAAMVNESTSGSQGEPTFSQVQLTAYTACVKAIASREVVADSDFRVVEAFAYRGGTALGQLEDDEVFKTGTGTAPHITKISGTTYSITSGVFRYTDALVMYQSVPQAYRDNAVWFVSPSVLTLLSNVRDSQWRQFYQGLTDSPGPISDDRGAVGTLLHKPVYEVNLTSGDLWFGDPNAQYTLGNRQGIEMRMSEHVRFAEREIMWLIDARIAGQNVDSSASQYVSGITSATTA